jgi:hypothetical protein
MLLAHSLAWQHLTKGDRTRVVSPSPARRSLALFHSPAGGRDGCAISVCLVALEPRVVAVAVAVAVAAAVESSDSGGWRST